MCGIVGIWQKNDVPIDPLLLDHMRDRIHYRGPNGYGTWVERSVGLAHRRLSIIDLSDAGKQPMVSDCGQYVIIYNGEIYNFCEIRQELEKLGNIFRSRTDTEVVLYAYRQWGEKCVKKFVGMFAFAIWDSKQKGMFLARDHIGIKPLYFYLNNDVFIFSSRLSPILLHPAAPRDIDSDALSLYLDVGYVPHPRSIVRGIQKLSPGHLLWVDGISNRIECYWSLQDVEIDASWKNYSENEIVSRLDDLFRQSVRAQLISDVPIGIFLSGGVDSSSIVSHASRLTSSQLKTFTIGFSESGYDETNHARDIARYLGTNHHERIMRSTDLLEYIEVQDEHYDEPFADYSSLPTMLVSSFAREQVSVCLSGDGGDELFIGYPHYFFTRRFSHLLFIPIELRRIVARFLLQYGGHRQQLIAHLLVQEDALDAFSYMRSVIKDFDPNILVERGMERIADVFRRRASRTPSAHDLISLLSQIDFSYYLPDDILQKVDVASMAVSLEARVPILDHRIVEFAYSLPIQVRLKYGRSKYLLKKMLSRYLPEHLYEHPKAGFGVPLREWFRGDLKDFLVDELSASRLHRIPQINAQHVEKLVQSHLLGIRDCHPILWALIRFVRWHEKTFQGRVPRLK